MAHRRPGREDVVGLDSSVILPRQVWVASGHVGVFTDPLTECLNCHKRFRADHLEEAFEAKKGRLPEGLTEITCPNCGVTGSWTEPRDFNMMLKTHLGPVEDESGCTTAPGDRAGHLRQLRQRDGRRAPQAPVRHRPDRQELPQRDHPGNFIFRTREFEQMEMEFFVNPARTRPGTSTGSTSAPAGTPTWASTPRTCGTFEHSAEKLSHYSKRTVDIEYRFGFQGSEWGELEGIANRTDFRPVDALGALGQRPVLLRPASGERWTPYVIEPAAGLTRSLMAFLVEAYREDEAPTPRAAPTPARCSRWTRGWPRSRPPSSRCRATPTSRPRPATWPPSCGRTGTSSSTTPAPSAAGTAARTRSGRRSASPSTSTPSRTRR